MWNDSPEWLNKVMAGGLHWHRAVVIRGKFVEGRFRCHFRGGARWREEKRERLGFLYSGIRILKVKLSLCYG